MIKMRQFMRESLFYEGRRCMFCVSQEPQGIYYVALDDDFNALGTKPDRNKPGIFAIYCKICNNCWISRISSEGQYILKNDIFNTASRKIPKVESPKDAIEVLTEEGYQHFIKNHVASKDFDDIITQFANYRAQADVTILSGSDRVESIEMPLNQYAEEMSNFIYTAFVESLYHEFYGANYLRQRLGAEELSEELREELSDTLFRILFSKIMTGNFIEAFFNTLYKKLSHFRAIYMEAAYKNWKLEDGTVVELKGEPLNHLKSILADSEDDLKNEVLGRCIRATLNGMPELIVMEVIKDKKEIIYGNLKLIAKGSNFKLDNVLVTENFYYHI